MFECLLCALSIPFEGYFPNNHICESSDQSRTVQNFNLLSSIDGMFLKVQVLLKEVQALSFDLRIYNFETVFSKFSNSALLSYFYSVK